MTEQPKLKVNDRIWWRSTNAETGTPILNNRVAEIKGEVIGFLDSRNVSSYFLLSEMDIFYIEEIKNDR